MFTSNMTGDDPSVYRALDNNYWAVQNLLDVDTPDINKMRVNLEKLVQQGILDPNLGEEFLQAASSYANIDPRYKDEQLGVLDALNTIVDTDGMDPQSRAVLHQLTGQTQAAERGGREAIMQNAAARGIGGSGLELGAQLSNQQGSATSLANQGFQAAADANQRKLQAINDIAGVSGQMFGQEAQAAQAQDAINNFNTSNRVNWRNQATLQNQAETQRIADQNTFLANQQELYNKGLYQQAYQNDLAKAQSLSNANLGVGQANMGVAEHERAPMMTELQGQSSKWSDENLKTDVAPFDSDAFLSQITGHEYKYKDPDKYGEGDQVGVMAQDVEKVAPQAVTEHSEGKMIDFGQLGGPIMASLADINERIKSLESVA